MEMQMQSHEDLESPLEMLFFADFKKQEYAISGGTQIWTGVLLICSEMLYHWAIPPAVQQLKLRLGWNY